MPGGLTMKTSLLTFLILFTLCCASEPGPGVNAADDSTLAATDLERVQKGTVAPDFTLESLNGERITLSDYRETKNVILVFYRGYW